MTVWTFSDFCLASNTPQGHYLRNILLENNFNTTKIQVKALGHDVSLGGNKDLVIISTN